MTCHLVLFQQPSSYVLNLMHMTLRVAAHLGAGGRHRLRFLISLLRFLRECGGFEVRSTPRCCLRSFYLPSPGLFPAARLTPFGLLNPTSQGMPWQHISSVELLGFGGSLGSSTPRS